MDSVDKRVIVQPISVIFKYLQAKTLLQIWMYDDPNHIIEGHLAGFDEYMNLVVTSAVEKSRKDGQVKELGRILLKGDTVSVIKPASSESGDN